MRRLRIYLTLAAVLLCAANASAQSDPPPPPPPAPDYSPQLWKEYVYEQDNVKFRFPVEPKITTTIKDEAFGKVTNRRYLRQSFVVLELAVSEFPAGVSFEEEAVKGLLDQMRDAGLERIKDAKPRLVKESDVTVDGRPAKFLHIETGDGKVIRAKFFIVKNRMYYGYAEVKKGGRHGHNFENDFEKVAMAFLDSVRLVSAGR